MAGEAAGGGPLGSEGVIGDVGRDDRRAPAQGLRDRERWHSAFGPARCQTRRLPLQRLDPIGRRQHTDLIADPEPLGERPGLLPALAAQRDEPAAPDPGVVPEPSHRVEEEVAPLAMPVPAEVEQHRGVLDPELTPRGGPPAFVRSENRSVSSPCGRAWTFPAGAPREITWRRRSIDGVKIASTVRPTSPNRTPFRARARADAWRAVRTCQKTGGRGGRARSERRAAVMSKLV